MKNSLRIISLLVALSLVAVAVASCNTTNTTAKEQPVETTQQSTTQQTTTQAPVVEKYAGYVSELDADGKYVRGDDEDMYDDVLGEFAEVYEKAGEETEPDKRFVLYAQAEALLLDSGVMVPTYTQGGAYTISRIAPHTVPYVQWGNDDDRLKSLVISDEFITKAERAELLAAWEKACAGEGSYDPAAILTGKGHTIQTTYTTTFDTAPVTIDWLNTSSQADTEVTVNTVDGLVEYTNTNQMVPALAESWTISDDGLQYTFKIRPDVYWYTSEGTKYAPVVAGDFVAGFHHMLDAKAGLEWLVEDVIKGAKAYLKSNGSFDDVGYEAPDDSTLVVTLARPTSYFLTMLTYSCFLPICESFYKAHGGVFGMEEYAAASLDTDKYTFGKSTDVSSQVYCGAFLLQKLDSDSEIVIVKNENYYKVADTTLTQVRWVKDSGENPTQTYKDAVAGVYAGLALTESTGTLKLAKEDGNFEKYGYVSDTNSTTFFSALNINRGTYALESGECASPKTEQQKADTITALHNKAFRQAIQYSFDQATWNAVTRGADLATTNLRNMYTHPQFVSLSSDQTDADGHKFTAGTFYGEMVQYYLVKLGSHIKVDDQIDGWYNPTEAAKALAIAKEELKDVVTFPIHLDLVYYTASESQIAQSQAFKKGLEDALGTDNVIVDLIGANTSDDYFACGYRAPDGVSGNYDVFYGSGWGPDYGDPSTYVDTFAPISGYMLKKIGLF